MMVIASFCNSEFRNDAYCLMGKFEDRQLGRLGRVGVFSNVLMRNSVCSITLKLADGRNATMGIFIQGPVGREKAREDGGRSLFHPLLMVGTPE